MINSKIEALEFIVENDVKFIRLQFCDIFGALKNVSITDSQITDAISNGIGFNEASIKGFASENGESEKLLLFPDISTMSVLPWRPQQGRVLRFFCDIKRQDGSFFESDSRRILKQTIKKAKDKGFEIDISPEFQFYLFKTNDDGRVILETHDEAGYLDVAPMDKGENVRREICLTAEDMGFEIKYSHHGNDFGQHEIAFKEEGCLACADNITTFKTIVKTISQRNGLYASFMPKPMNDTVGSSLKLNISGTYNSENLFTHNEISKQFMAGIIAHFKAISAFAKPVINSYKRQSGSTFNKICIHPSSKRIEFGVSDPAANPYLLFAMLIEAGIDGVENKLINSEVCLPKSLSEALQCANTDMLVKNIVGEAAWNEYIFTKTAECETYSNTVHQWEVDKYLNSL